MIAALIAFTLECYALVYHYYPGVDDPSKPSLRNGTFPVCASTRTTRVLMEELWITSMWNAIGYVTTGLTLLAFAIAVGAGWLLVRLSCPPCG